MANEQADSVQSPERVAAERAVLARRVARRTGDLTTAATQRMEATLPWFTALPANERASVGTVAQAGINTFVDWFTQQRAESAQVNAIFSSAPRDLARALTLHHTVELLRTTMDVVEESVDSIAGNNTARQSALREALLRFSREIAFAAAEVYAQAAEERGAWDARLHDLVFDAIVDGKSEEVIIARSRALGWDLISNICALVGPIPAKRQSLDLQMEQIRRVSRHHGLDAIVGMQRQHLVVIISGLGEGTAAHEALGPLLPFFGPGSIVCGPIVKGVVQAQLSFHQALSGFEAVSLVTARDRLLSSESLIAARVIAGDAHAVGEVIDTLATGLKSDVVETLATYLEQEPTIEGCARAMYVHVNTIRYRLRRVVEVTGYDPTEPSDALTLRLALMIGRNCGKL